MGGNRVSGFRRAAEDGRAIARDPSPQGEGAAQSARRATWCRRQLAPITANWARQLSPPGPDFLLVAAPQRKVQARKPDHQVEDGEEEVDRHGSNHLPLSEPIRTRCVRVGRWSLRSPVVQRGIKQCGGALQRQLAPLPDSSPAGTVFTNANKSFTRVSAIRPADD